MRISILILACLFLSCERWKADLPAKTRHGANLMGFIYGDGDVEYVPARQMAVYHNDSLDIDFEWKRDNGVYDTDFKLSINSVNGQSSFMLSLAELIINNYDTLVLDTTFNSTYFSVEFLDENRNIVSGEYEFNFVQYEKWWNTDSTYELVELQKISLKEGRYDLIYSLD